MFGPDWLANLFLFFFFFGLIFTIASLVLGFADIGGDGGHLSHIGGHGIHINLPGPHDLHIHVGSHSQQGGQHGTLDGPGFFNAPSIMAFITWFGGVGYILRQSLHLSGFIVAPLAVISGVTGATIMFLLLARILWPMMSKPLSQSEFHLPGTVARVVSSIREGGVGEIVYSKRGTRFTAGAMSEDGDAVPKGAEVVIMRYERGLAYVVDVADLRARESDGLVESLALEGQDEPARLQKPDVARLDEGSVRSDRQTSRR